LRGMGTTNEKFRENVKQDMPEDAMEQGDAIVRRNPKLQMPDSHFKLQGAQEQQMMDEMELDIPEFKFNEEQAKTAGGLREMERSQAVQRMLNAYKRTYKDHVMQAFDKHKAFMQSLGNQPMTVQEFMQHPKVPSFTDYYKQANEGTIPGGDYAEGHPFAITHPEEYIDHRDSLNLYGGLVQNNNPFIPVITGEPMDLALDALLKMNMMPPMTQGIEEQMPMQEDIPTVDVTQGYETDCECAERLRGFIIEEIQEEINYIRENDGSSLDPSLTVAQLVDAQDTVENMSCEEIIENFPDFYQEECGNTNQGFSEADQMKYAGEPMDLAIDTLLKFQSAAQRRIYSEIPTLEERGLEPKDLNAMRLIYTNRLENKGKPTFFHQTPLVDSRAGGPLRHEREVYDRNGITIPGFTRDYEPPKDLSQGIGGTFVYGPDVLSISPLHHTRMIPRVNMFVPDISPSDRQSVLLGILDKPEWVAGMKHKRTMPEGYQPMGFDKDAYVRLDGGLGNAALGTRWDFVNVANNMMRGGFPELDPDAHNLPLIQSMLSKLPATDPYNEITGGNDLDDILLDSMGGARIVASEPMDLAIDALLKREIHPGYPEDMSIEDMINAGHDYPFNKDKYPDEYLANYPEEHIEEYGERPFNPTEPGEQPLHVGLSQRDIDDYREQVYRETLERMSTIDNSRDNESWAKWIASEAMPPAPQDSPLRLTRQIMVPIKNADENDVDGLMDMPDESGATVVQSFAGIPMNEETGFTRSEPMDLAIDALLKRELHPGPFSEIKYNYEAPDFELHPDWEKWTDEVDNNPYEYEGLGEDWTQNDMDYIAGSQSREEFFKRIDEISNFQRDEDKHPNAMRPDDYFDDYHFRDVPFNEETGFTRSEPMALAMDALLKDLSPEAKRHKLEYDKKYESSPERVKYREQLNRERRRRGIYGSGDHMDVSHTEGGKLTLEPEHDNRARHFKDKGTLRPSD